MKTIVDWSRGGSTNFFYVFMFAILVIAIVVNIVQFGAIEKKPSHNYKAWHLYESIDLFEVAITHDDSSRLYTAPFWLIGRQFPGSSFVLPLDNRSSWFEVDLSLKAFGHAGAIHFSDYDSTSVFRSAQFEAYRFPLEEYLLARGSTHRVIRERVGVYVAEPSSGVFVLSTPHGNPGRRERMEFVDIFLLAEEFRPEVGD